ncbi:MAG: LacI family DNA-binding transcriptional regulator [Anaerolineae bacterium]|nr:LacI family DNA-binding transcriptional regulator [Anaerolineae bacterium]
MVSQQKSAMRKRVTIKDVAAHAGVSTQTVSRVLNEKGYVAEDTRQRVLAAIEELEYRPSAVAKSMVTGQTHMLGCIAPTLTDYTFARIIEGAQMEARRQGYFILTGNAPDENDVESLLKEMVYRRVDGILMLNPRADARYRHLLPLIEQGMPVVYQGNSPDTEPVSSVQCDNRDGGYQATEYLLQLNHKTIATLTGPPNEQCTQDRLKGYQQALKHTGQESNPELTVHGDWSALSGYQAVKTLLKEKKVFTAIFSQNDRMAIGAIRALNENGYAVPNDISVIGFDDIPLASYLSPPLTTLHQPLESLGRHAAQLLIDTVKDANYPREQLSIKTELIRRGSCGSPRI